MCKPKEEFINKKYNVVSSKLMTKFYIYTFPGNLIFSYILYTKGDDNI